MCIPHPESNRLDEMFKKYLDDNSKFNNINVILDLKSLISLHFRELEEGKVTIDTNTFIKDAISGILNVIGTFRHYFAVA